MEPLSSTIRIAQILGITTSAFLSGTLFSASLLSVPALLALPYPHILTGWFAMYSVGKASGPPMSLFGVANHLFVAYSLYTLHSPLWVRFVGAAAATMAIVPFTLVFMVPTNQRLIDAVGDVKVKGEKEKDVGEEEARALVGRWRVLNFLRGVPPLVGALVAGWAALQ